MRPTGFTDGLRVRRVVASGQVPRHEDRERPLARQRGMAKGKTQHSSWGHFRGMLLGAFRSRARGTTQHSSWGRFHELMLHVHIPTLETSQ